MLAPRFSVGNRGPQTISEPRRGVARLLNHRQQPSGPDQTTGTVILSEVERSAVRLCGASSGTLQKISPAARTIKLEHAS